MSFLETSLSKEDVKSLLKLKILNKNKVINFQSPIQCSASTNITPIIKFNIDTFSKSNNISSIVGEELKEYRKNIRMSEETIATKDSNFTKDTLSFKTRITQSYKSLSVETNNKVKNWKTNEFIQNKNKKEKKVIVSKLKIIQANRQEKEFEKKKFEFGANSMANSNDIKFKFLSQNKNSNLKRFELNAHEIPKETTKFNNKDLRKMDSKEYAEKIIVNLHSRMESFSKIYNNISTQLNSMIIQVKETDKEKDLTLTNFDKTRKMNNRYEEGKIEKELDE